MSIYSPLSYSSKKNKRKKEKKRRRRKHKKGGIIERPTSAQICLVQEQNTNLRR